MGKLYLLRTLFCGGVFLMLYVVTQVNQALGEDNLLKYDCDTWDHGFMVINLSQKKVYFLDEVTIFTDTPPDRSEFYASSEDDDYSVRLWLKDFDPYLENPASSFSFTWSADVMNGSEELIGNNYTEGFCTRVSHH